jgi:DNA (cytosine-5)-methyltransferase 1
MGKVHASLFSGFGSADLAATWMGWDNAFWCEIDDFPRTVLSYWFPKSKGYGNIKETDFKFWRGKIDVLTGGFPCQPFSVAGQRKGQEDDRYLWPEMLRAIREIRPSWIIGENVGGIISMVQPGCETEVEHQAALFEETDKETILEQEYVVETVCRDLEQEGYSVQPVVIPACAVGAPHRRDRIFFIAYCSDARAEGVQQEGKDGIYQSKYAANANIIRYQRECIPEINDKKRRENKEGFFKEHAINNRRLWKRFPTQPPVCRGNDGLPFDVVRLTISLTAWCTGSIKGYGNAIVPQVMYEIFKAIETIQE